MLRCPVLGSVLFKTVKIKNNIAILLFCLISVKAGADTDVRNQQAINNAFSEAESGFMEEDQETYKSALDSAVNSSKMLEQGMPSALPSTNFKNDYSEIMNGLIDPLIDSSKNQLKKNEPSNKYGFSDSEMADLRSKTLEAFGIDRGIQGFIFVSRSMQNSLIRSYALQAEKYGFQLIFKGPEKNNVDIIETMKKWGDLFHTTSSLMAIQMDPRLFDAFEIVHVPSIVLTSHGSLGLCEEGQVKHIQHGLKTLPLKTCKPVASEDYCKISGPVSLDWAVDYMAKSGCNLAEDFLDLAGDKPAKSILAISQESWIQAIQKTAPSKEISRYNQILMEQLTGVHFK